MTGMDNKELVRSCFEKACVHHDLDGASELVSEDYFLHDPMAPDFSGGREGFKAWCRSYIDAIPDCTCTIEDQVAEGDRVATRFSVSGCQTKDLPGVPSKGGCFKVNGISISRVAEGKIAEEWMYMDSLGMRDQLGTA
ncbi:MAG: ester cyclase [Thermodesulfobacteriota bacterium]